jgi:hypothetical protein
MHSTIATGEKKLEDLLVGGEGVDPNETITKRMTFKFYKSTMNKTKWIMKSFFASLTFMRAT